MRSLAGLSTLCQVTGVREQTNQLSHWLDASNVYGSSDTELDTVREGKTARLKVRRRSGRRELLPSCPAAASQSNACGLPCDNTTNCQVR